MFNKLLIYLRLFNSVWIVVFNTRCFWESAVKILITEYFPRHFWVTIHEKLLFEVLERVTWNCIKSGIYFLRYEGILRQRLPGKWGDVGSNLSAELDFSLGFRSPKIPLIKPQHRMLTTYSPFSDPLVIQCQFGILELYPELRFLLKLYPCRF